MSEYQGLRYKTRGDAAPQGRPRIYFCCHNDDFNRLFEPVSEEILSLVPHAAIWYYDPKDGIPEDDQLFSDLGQMQLFILPVTKNFVYQDCRARTEEFAYALEHHIPLLPILKDPGLEQDFNRICGDLQLLDKNAAAKDPTAIPYEEKLKTFLNAVIVSDETANRVRDAFDAYIFLSYRKKDRASAQQIMRLIHQNEFCRDVAIWYDEFLTPGENFNEAISAAMQKSTLFALVVTPSLLEDPNYVMTTEYPEAKRSGKAILPVEAQETDAAELSRLYEGIDRALQPAQLAGRLKEALPGAAPARSQGDPAHDFLIGLAYLSGIDVEVDHEKALQLITSAAEADLPEALDKLASMYSTGEGVRRSSYQMLQWYRRYTEVLQRLADEDPSEEKLHRLFGSLLVLGNMQIEVDTAANAVGSYNSMLAAAERMDALGYPAARSDLQICYRKFGDLAIKEGRTADAKELYQKSLQLAETLTGDSGSAEARRRLMHAFDRMGDICQSEKAFDEEKEWRRKSIIIAEDLVRENATELERRNMIISYSNYAELCIDNGDLPEAKAWFLKGLENAETLAKEFPSQKNRRVVSHITGRLGYNCLETGDLAEAKEWFKKSFDLRIKLADEQRTWENRRDLEVGYIRMEGICRKMGDIEEADKWLQEKEYIFGKRAKKPEYKEASGKVIPDPPEDRRTDNTMPAPEKKTWWQDRINSIKNLFRH